MHTDKIIAQYNKQFSDTVNNDYIRFRLSSDLKTAFLSFCKTQHISSSLLLRALIADCLKQSNQKDISKTDISDSALDDITYLAKKLHKDKKDIIDNAITMYTKQCLQDLIDNDNGTKKTEKEEIIFDYDLT